MDHESTGSGDQLTPSFSSGVKEYRLTPTSSVYKAYFAAFESLSYTINTIHSIHYAHIKLSLAYHTLAENSRVLQCQLYIT